MNRILIGILAALLTAGAQKADEAERLLKAAQNTELVDGNLKAAIEQYKKAAQTGNRGVAAQALIRMAECYQKLGDTESKKIYERVLREYGDQKEPAAIARVKLGHGEGSTSSGVLVRQIWTGDGVNLTGRPSPDGRYFVYSDWNTRNLVLRNMKSGQSRFLTKDARAGGRPGGYYYPVFSPDGKQVAYQSLGDSLRVVGVDGSGMRTLINTTADPVPWAWSPDGKQLVAVVSSPTHQITLISTIDGSVTQLKSTGWRYPIIGGFSPDGQWLVYSLPKTDPSASDGGIFAIARDGSQETTLVEGSANDANPFWTPDGQAIFFTSDRSGSKGLWSLRVAGGKPQGAPELVRPNLGDANIMGFARTGSFFYGTYNRQVDVYSVGIDAQTLKPVGQPSRITENFVGSNWGPAWSPDGKSIAFFRAVDSSSLRAVVVKSTSSGEERTLRFRIQQGGYVPGYFSPSWFPDSRSLLILDSANSRWSFKRIDVNTGDSTVALEGENIHPQVRLSPDGKTIYFTLREQSPDYKFYLLRLMKKNLETGGEVELYRADSPGAGFFGLAVSPDGAYLSFSRNLPERGKRTLMTVPTAGGAAREIYKGIATKLGPRLGAWSADGRQILFASHTDKQGELWAIPAEGGEPRSLMTMEEISFAQLSPDGRRIAFTGTTSKGELWVIDNLLSGLGVSR